MSKIDKKSKPFVPGDHVRTPYGLAWVNVAPVGGSPDEVFIRLGDNSTCRVDSTAIELVDF